MAAAKCSSCGRDENLAEPFIAGVCVDCCRKRPAPATCRKCGAEKSAALPFFGTICAECVRPAPSPVGAKAFPKIPTRILANGLAGFLVVAAMVACLVIGATCFRAPVPAPPPDGPSPAQVAAAADLAKQTQLLADERSVLAKEREAFRAEQQQADQRATERAAAIQAATAEYEAAVKRQEQRRDAEDAAQIAAEEARRHRQDLAMLGAMDPLERMRVQSAAMAFKSGRATTDQLDRLLPFNEYRDDVIAEFARRGAGANSGLLRPPSGIKSSSGK